MKFTLLLAFLVTVRAFAPAQSTEDDVWFANEHDNLVEIDQIHQQSQRLYESGGLDAVQEYLTGTYRYTVAGNVFRPYCNAIVFQKPYEQDTLEWARNAFLLSHPFFPQGTVLPLAVASWREWLQGATNGETKIFGLDLDVVDSEYLTRKLADDITFVFDVNHEFRTLNKHMKVADELVIACSYTRIAEKEACRTAP